MAVDWQLERFVAAQAPVYAQVCAQLAAGHKRTHWVWFIFPLQRPDSTDAHAIFGSPDTLKLRSCMGLFEIVAPEAPVFGDVLVRYLNRMRDEATVARVHG